MGFWKPSSFHIPALLSRCHVVHTSFLDCDFSLLSLKWGLSFSCPAHTLTHTHLQNKQLPWSLTFGKLYPFLTWFSCHFLRKKGQKRAIQIPMVRQFSLLSLMINFCSFYQIKSQVYPVKIR